jgi:hypothetical protein
MKNKKIIINKFTSFKEAEEWEDEYYLFKSKEERLSDIQYCREIYFKLLNKNAGRKRFRRVFRVIKQIPR